MDDILKDLGWDDGFRIPVANAENRALELEVQKKQKEKENLKSVLEDVDDRLSGMKKHLLNVKHQLDQNQNLIFAQTNQKEAEENLVKLSRLEDDSLTNDLKRIKKEQRDVLERENVIQMDINKTQQNIEKLNTNINWDKDALLAWDEEVSRGDDDTIMLEKFRRDDESKFKELELKRQSLGLEVENKKNRLIDLKNDVLAMEQSLDKTAQLFRRQHVDRRALVQQWEGSVRILYQRDEDINRVVEEISNLKTLAKERLKDLEEQKIFYDNEVKNNKEVEKDIEVFNKQGYETKEKIRMIEEILMEEHDKLSTLKTVLATTTAQYHSELRKQKNMMKEIETRNEQLEDLKMKLERAKNEFKKAQDKKISAVERVQQLDEMLKEEEKNAEKNLIEFKKLNELMYQVMQQITELKEGEKSQVSSLRHIEACTLTTKKNIAKAVTELNRQKEILYNLDFAYMEKDILLNKLQGSEKNKEDLEKLEKRISELEEIHSKLLATNSLLTKEVSRLEDDMRRITIDLQIDSKEENYLKNKLQENVLLVECGQKQLKTLRLQNQDKQVDENLLKLRVRQAEKAIDKVGEKVFSLEKQRLELEEAMKEREIEIKTLRDILNVRRRVLNEQASNLNSRVNLARVKVEHLKNKYEVAVSKLGKDENGEPLSITYLKIKSAQEKFELQELGDKLDSKIKRTEKEILAMENTLKVVNATNRAYKNNLQSIDANSPEVLEKEELEQIHAQLLEEYREKKVILEGLHELTISLEHQYQEKIQIEESILKMWKEKDQQAAEIDKELKDQEEKLERADKKLKRLIKEIRGTKIQKFQTIEEKDIELRELMEQNQYGLQQLAELVAKTYDTGPVVMQYLSEKGLSIPLIKSPSASIKYASSASVVSTGRSSASSKSSSSQVSRTSSCVITPSVVTLDSTRLSEESRQKSSTKGSSSGKIERRRASSTSLKEVKKEKRAGFE